MKKYVQCFKRGLFFSLLLISGFAGNAQQLAFPGAEGFGRFAKGGRGGSVYYVTNLNDAGAGSLRDAVSQPNRTVLFKVSGTIYLQSTLKISQNNITIAGQTAPGDGICVANYTVSVQANDIIIRYMRFRMGDMDKDEDDALHANGGYSNIIIDHCSMSWSIDETASFYDNTNFTLQWCILSESLYNSDHPKGNHGYAGIWGGEGASFHHNLLAHHTSRTPRFCGSRYTGKPDLEIVDMRNNVIYNWGNINSAYGGEGGNQNIVNNYYKPGPATPGSLTTSSASNKRNRILQYTSYYYGTDAAVYPDTLFGGKFYIDGNYVDGYPDVSADNWTNGVQLDGYYRAAELKAAARQTVPFSFAPVTTQTAQEAYLRVLDSAGAILPKRDAVDTRIVNETRTGTATYEGATYGAINATGISHPSGIIDSQNDVGGYPTLNSTTPPVDTDGDGIPDAWETAHNLNPNDAADGNTVNSNGYTMLEVYLNSIGPSEESDLPVQTPASVTWQPSGSSNIPGNPPIVSGSVTGADQATGDLTAYQYSSTVGGISGGWQRVYGSSSSSFNGTLPSTSYSSTSYLEYKVTPSAGQYLQINSFQISAFGGGTGNARLVIQYSTDGTNFLDMPVAALYDATSYAATVANPVVLMNTNTTPPADSAVVNFSGLAINITPAQSFYIRVYPYLISAATGKYLPTRQTIISGVTSSSPFSTATPLHLLSFNAVLTAGNQVKLDWTVTNEENTKNFAVERSTDGKNFAAIGNVAAQNTSGIHEYSDTDEAPAAGINYYRLKQIDKDGVYTYSEIISVNKKGDLDLSVYPNPVSGALTIEHAPAGKNAYIRIVSVSGAVKLRQSVAEGERQTKVDVLSFAPGIYFLQIYTSAGMQVRKFFKK